MHLLTIAACVMIGQPLEIVTIKYVVDSNTVVVVRDGERDSLTVDLAGVGTPETVDPKKPNYLLGVADPGGTQTHLLPGTKVGMETVGETTTGRPLVILYRLQDRFCWNSWLIEVGGAFFTTTTLVNYSDQEERAQAKHLGLWSHAPKPVTESDLAPQAIARRTPKATTPASPRAVTSRPSVASTSGASRAVTLQSFDPSHFTGVRRPRRYANQDGAWNELNGMMSMMWQSSLPSSGGGVGVNPNQHWVNGHARSNGAYVQGYMRTNPNSTVLDNFGRR